MSYHDDAITSRPTSLADLAPSARKLVRQLAAAGGSGYTVGAMRGREALVTERAGDLWRGDAYNYETYRVLRRRGVVEFGESVEIPGGYANRQRGDTATGDPITLTDLGRTLAGLSSKEMTT